MEKDIWIVMVRWLCCRLHFIGIFIILVNLSCGEKTSGSEEISNHLFSVAEETISTYSKSGRVVSEIDKKEYKRVVLLATPFYTYFEALNVENSIAGLFNKERVKRCPKALNRLAKELIWILRKLLNSNQI